MTRGILGESLAATYLTDKGFQIVQRNFRTRFGEIDIIAQNHVFLVFAEVKLRKSAKFGAPRESVTKVKQQKLVLAAEEWLSMHHTALQPRFDVVEIYLPEGSHTPTAMHHLENAFDA